jgi:hypothetical protein
MTIGFLLMIGSGVFKAEDIYIRLEAFARHCPCVLYPPHGIVDSVRGG